ncbi:MAG: winged helix-turn-helix domain-containing protein [Halohasta sp.]
MTLPPTIAEPESKESASASAATAGSTPAAAGTDSTDAVAADSTEAVDTETLLALLGDAYACRLLTALDEEPLSAADLVDRCEMSRPTVYRRLDRLTDAGLVETTRSLSASGHHQQEYRLAVESVQFSLSADGVDGELREAPSGC